MYNSLFKMSELENALDRVYTFPGEDKINYQMIKKLNNDSKIYPLDILNTFWIDSFFPVEWQHSIIIPISKPGKDHSQSDNYRPIALTSCPCKLLERIVNNRLIDYFEMYKIITAIQCRCQQGCSTTDHLVRLESVIRMVFYASETLLCIKVIYL